VAERLNAPVLKTGKLARASGVRISPSPPKSGPEDKKRLDAAEGLGRGYGDRSINVVYQAWTLRVRAYYATSIDLHVKPYDWYRDLVVAGAREHGLPDGYIAMLASIPVMEILMIPRVLCLARCRSPEINAAASVARIPGSL
jgi:AIG2-like family